MPATLTLFDLVAPTIAADGISSGSNVLDALKQLPVKTYLSDEDQDGSVIRGRVALDDIQLVYVPPLSLSVAALIGGAAATRPRDQWIDIRDSYIDFIAHLPNVPAAMFDGVSPVADEKVLDALAAAPSDAPGTGFTLDLLLNAVTIRPPGLIPARLEDGLLRPDPVKTEVRFTLPRIKLRLAQPPAPPAGGTSVPLTLTLQSLGAEGLDDPGAIGVAQLCTMDPPYALVDDSGTFGFGFRSATLDLDDGVTPPELLAKFGVDDAWRGIYLPEARLYFAYGGKEGLAFTGLLSDFLIGIEDGVVLSGDATVAVVEQGSGTLLVNARFATATRTEPYGLTFLNSDQTRAEVALPGPARMVVDIDGGRRPYDCTITVGGNPGEKKRSVDLTPPATGTLQVKVVVTDANTSPGPPRSRTIDIAVSLLATKQAVPQLPGQPAPPGATPDATVVTAAGSSPGLKFRVAGQNETEVELVLDPPSAKITNWTGPGTPPAGPVYKLKVAPGETVAISAQRDGSSETVKAYWHFDRPPIEYPPCPYSLQPSNTRTSPALDDLPTGQWTTDRLFAADVKPRLDALPGGEITITGFASYEGDPLKVDYNQLLSERRAKGIAALIASTYGSKFTFAPHGEGFAASKQETEDAAKAGQPKPPRNLWWRADVTLPAGAGVQATGTVTREKTTAVTLTPLPVDPVDPPPAADPALPPWFLGASVKVRIIRDELIALELAAKIDFKTAVEDQFQHPQLKGQPLALTGVDGNDKDGQTDFRVVIQRDPGTATVTTTIFVGADEGDKDGLFLIGPPPGAKPDDNKDLLRAYLGFLATFLPLVEAALPKDAPGGGLYDVAEVGGLPLVLALSSTESPPTLPLIVERVILYGIEATVEQRDDGTQTSFMFDVETALSAAIPDPENWFLRISRERPLSVRYKAVGVRIGKPADASKGFEFRPVFDSSRGYTIDASRPGQIEVKEPLSRILRVLGARIGKTNPPVFEIDIGTTLELGPVTIDRARVRMPLDPPGLPELTALGATVDVPGALRGRGELEINDNGLSGGLDVTVVPIGLRIAADVVVEKCDKTDKTSATSVFVSLAVEFPAPLPLWTSGLGIYGFLGAFAMNRRRIQAPGSGAPGALAWLAQYGDPTNREGWEAAYGEWGFAVGAVLGTLDGGILFNLRGALILELPGPNILLTMKARLLAPRQSTPPNTDTPIPAVEALAVIDVDLENGTLSIGILVSYEIKWLLKLHVPIEAFFDLDDSSNWHIWAGQYAPPEKRIQAKVFGTVDGSGYLMLQGDKLKIGDSKSKFEEVSGFGVAAGISVTYKLGDESIGLYARVGGGFDALIGFDPLRFQAKLQIDGELHLFIVSIGAHAELDVSVAKIGNEASASISGEICGHVDFFFFDVEGCVDFGLGTTDLPTWEAPRLISDFAVVSRSPTLAMGTAIGRPVDAKLPDIMSVPIDSIPVITFRAPPADWPAKIFGKPVSGTPGGSTDGLVPAGEKRVRYEVTSVTLEGPLDSDPSADDTPSVWWRREKAGKVTAGMVQLALLTRTPTPFPKAIEYGDRLTQDVINRWHNACGTAAPPTSILWTFLRQYTGPSPVGWRIWDGVAWPDEPGVIRSEPPDIELNVDEAWRVGSTMLDAATGIEPAAVEIRALPCPPLAPKKWRNKFLPAYGEADKILQQRLEIESALALSAAAGGGTFGALATKFKPGDGVGGKQMQQAVAISGRYQDRVPWNCYARMLGSPILDEGGESGFVPPQSPLLEQLFGKPPAAAASGPTLWNAVRVHVGSCVSVQLFLLGRPLIVRQHRLAVLVRAADGTVLQSYAVGDEATTLTMPERWTNFAGPWQRPMAFVSGFNASLGYTPVLMTLTDLADAAWIEIGVSPAEPSERKTRAPGRDFYLGAIEALRTGEVARAAHDEQEIAKDKEALDTALSADGKYALLKRGTDYNVNVQWRWQVEGEKDFVAENDVLPFRTDNEPPASIRPWVLAAHPAEGEAHVFGGEKVSITFATNDVAQLWRGYDHSLRIKLRAASFRQPTSAISYPWSLDDLLVEVEADVLSPWEKAVEAAQAKGEHGVGCAVIDHHRKLHAELKVPAPLDPFTDYTLVVEAVDERPESAIPPGSGNPPPAKVVLSIGFSTSAYGTARDFAQGFAASAVSHAHIAGAADLRNWALKRAGGTAEGTEFDDMLAQAGLGALPVPTFPRATVLWADGDDVAEPIAILLDGSEAIWRSRPMPRGVPDPESDTTRTVMTPVQWLCPVELAPGTAQPAAAGARWIGATVAAPGGQRGLFVLNEGARSHAVALGLRHVKLAEGPPSGGDDPAPVEPSKEPVGPPFEWLPMVAMTLARAPWEDDLP